MNELQLNTKKIKNELKRIGKNKRWLAEQIGVSKPMVSYIFKNKPISFAVKIAEIFDIDPKDLIRSNNVS